MSFFFIVCTWVLQFHLHLFAGGILSLSGDKLKPVITIKIEEHQAQKLTDLTYENASKILSLHLVADDVAAILPVFGKYTLKNHRLSFVPLYPLGYNLCYEIQYHQGSRLIIRRFTTPGLPLLHDTVRVVQVYPISDTIPANILFFHVRFRKPMMQDISAWRYVTITSEQNDTIRGTWRQHSFWLDSGRLLVLMIHPGRVKTGIHYTGPVFEPDMRYMIHVTGGLKEINGQPVMINFSKEYSVKNEDRAVPEIREVTPVMRNNMTKSFSITFSKGMDHASLLSGIKIIGQDNRVILCTFSQLYDDKIIITPRDHLPKGTYKIIFESSVSDFAGNRLNRPFEITHIEEKLKDTIQVFRSFEIK